MMNWNRIRDRLKARRLALGLSQRALGARMEVRQSRISELENGLHVPGFTMFLAWIGALRLTFDLKEIADDTQ